MFDLKPVALGSMLNDMLWSIRPQVGAKALSLAIEVAEDLPNIVADAHYLRSALLQLLDNARRYTDVGSITIRAAHVGDRVRVDISDTGHGISSDLSEHLFMRFTRGSDGINSAERGIGLGLAIARQLIERQGGMLWLDSTSEHGSTFSLTLQCVHEETQHSNNAIATAA